MTNAIVNIYNINIVKITFTGQDKNMCLIQVGKTSLKKISNDKALWIPTASKQVRVKRVRKKQQNCQCQLVSVKCTSLQVASVLLKNLSIRLTFYRASLR